MTTITDEQEESISQNRRSNSFRFERSFNVGTIVSLIALLVAITTAYNGIISRFDHYDRSAIKSDIMWEHFVREHTDINSSDYERLR